MKSIKHIATLLLTIASVCGVNAGEIRTFNHNGEEYSIETRWLNTNALLDYSHQKSEGKEWGYSPFFFVKDDLVYFTNDATNYGFQSSKLMAVDGKTGEFSQIYPIDWGSYTPNQVAAVYAGVDSEGTYYVASYGTSTDPKYPFHIYPLSFEDNVIKVTGCYSLDMENDWWVQSVDVYGSLMTGNFNVASFIWNSMDGSSSHKTWICIWDYSDKVSAGKHIFDENVTVADVKMLSDNKLAIHDRHLFEFYSGSNKVDYGATAIAKEPSLYIVDGDKLTLQSSISPSPDDDGFGNGMSVFSLGDKHFMIYASSGMPAEFKLMSLPNYPDSFEGASEICILTPKSAGLSWDRPENFRYRTSVYTEKTDDNTVNIFVTGHNKGMASYTIKCDSPINTGIENINTEALPNPSEYYSITGQRLSDRPTSGFYIEKKGSTTYKRIAVSQSNPN